MAAPTITFKFNDVSSDTDATNWTAITGDVITFTGAGSSNGDLKPIQRPDATGQAIRIADELWINTGTDLEVQLYDAGGQEVADTATDIFPSNPSNTNTFGVTATVNPETQAGEMEAWDDGTFTTDAKETLDGTASTLIGHSQLRCAFTANDVTEALTSAGSIPGAYLTQVGTTTTYQLQGSTRTQTAAGALSTGNQNRFIIHLFIVDDSTEGAETIELTYRYFYT